MNKDAIQKAVNDRMADSLMKLPDFSCLICHERFPESDLLVVASTAWIRTERVCHKCFLNMTIEFKERSE